MKIGRKEIDIDKPTYFIADIASNHDGSLERAVHLIYVAAEEGANAVKFQNFRAETIVSDYGFKQLGKKAHQANWDASVYETYKKYETPLEWTPILRETADAAGVDYLTTPYDLGDIPYLSTYVSAWKVGSGDITYTQLINLISKYPKPIILGVGASAPQDIRRAIEYVGRNDYALLQCNTNYSGLVDNFNYINLYVITILSRYYSNVVGLSDHTPGHATVLGAVALGARIIEKHFTDNTRREGPDHSFSMDPVSWGAMVRRTRELESALGDGIKRIEENEVESVVLQRRAIRAARDLREGERISPDSVEFLRPCPSDALPPYAMDVILGHILLRDVKRGDFLQNTDVGHL